MIALARNFRLVPIVVFATASLFVLKTLGILLDGGFALGPDRSPPTSAPAARPPRPRHGADATEQDRCREAGVILGA